MQQIVTTAIGLSVFIAFAVGIVWLVARCGNDPWPPGGYK